MACPTCKTPTQWPNAYCTTCGMAKLRAMKTGDTARFHVPNGSTLVKLALRAGTLARHSTVQMVDDVPLTIDRQWANDGQGVEYSWALKIGSQLPLKGQMYLPYDQVEALSDPELMEALC